MTDSSVKQDKYWIYVIELPPAAAADTKLQRENPNHDRAKECLYVGSTKQAIEERFDDHRLRRGTSAKITEKYGVVRLRPDLAANKYALGRAKAEEIEAKLALKLRAQGYAVWQR